MKANDLHISLSEEKVLEAISSIKPLYKHSVADVWAKLENEIDAPAKQTKVITLNPYQKFYYAAAVILVLITISISVFYPFNSIIKTGIKQQLSYSLPDGSVVSLNACTKVTYNDKTWDEKRKVNLSGEAFFDVKKGRKFNVNTSEGSIEVKGTTFNIYSRDNNLTVSCYTGSVMVRFENYTDSILLMPGEKAEIVNGGCPKKISDMVSEPSWKKGMFEYEAYPVDQVFDEIERQFGVKVQVPDLQGEKYTGYFSNKNLDEALELICLPMQLNYIVEDKEIIISLAQEK